MKFDKFLNMEFKKKEEILAEIEKEETLCKEIYNEILRNRIVFEEEIRAIQLDKNRLRILSQLNSSRKSINNSKENLPETKEIAVSPIKVIGNSDSQHWSHTSKNSPFRMNNQYLDKKREIRIPLGPIPISRNFDGTSSRKNPLDSLRSTNSRNELISSFDSLQYSEDLSFL